MTLSLGRRRQIFHRWFSPTKIRCRQLGIIHLPGNSFRPRRSHLLELLRCLKLDDLSLLAVKLLQIVKLSGDNLHLLHLKNLHPLHFMALHRLTVLYHTTLMETQKILLSSKLQLNLISLRTC
ncbi:hypothetical protein Bca52824_026811 [Brassica carinata]|uniref:Uncharacterized protein n=1 Tax=Brassica carinata TaxID=52824 RepID=A0A8X7SIR2_BRACI|nr:hypothetical protein Bca52824_026811 [Brassica carinata]